MSSGCASSPRRSRGFAAARSTAGSPHGASPRRGPGSWRSARRAAQPPARCRRASLQRSARADSAGRAAATRSFSSSIAASAPRDTRRADAARAARRLTSMSRGPVSARGVALIERAAHRRALALLHAHPEGALEEAAAPGPRGAPPGLTWTSSRSPSRWSSSRWPTSDRPAWSGFERRRAVRADRLRGPVGLPGLRAAARREPLDDRAGLAADRALLRGAHRAHAADRRVHVPRLPRRTRAAHARRRAARAAHLPGDPHAIPSGARTGAPTRRATWSSAPSSGCCST